MCWCWCWISTVRCQVYNIHALWKAISKVLSEWLSQWVSDKVTYWAVRWQLKRKFVAVIPYLINWLTCWRFLGKNALFRQGALIYDVTFVSYSFFNVKITSSVNVSNYLIWLTGWHVDDFLARSPCSVRRPWFMISLLVLLCNIDKE